MPKKHPNILHLAIDSLLSTHMSCYGYKHLTTPHMDKLARQGVLFENSFSPHIPTTSAYASMLTGRDCFGTQVVALRHKGDLTDEVKTLAEVCSGAGYNTSCVGFTGNPSARGFDKYIDYPAWGGEGTEKAPKAHLLNEVTVPEIEHLEAEGMPWYLMLRHMDPHSPYLPPEPFDRMFYYGDEFDPKNKSMEPVRACKPFWDYFSAWLPEGLMDTEYVVAQYDGAVAYMDACIQRLFNMLETRGILDETLIIINGDHGETLDDHECYFDHHGLYDVTLRIPVIIRYPGKVPAGLRVSGFNQLKNLMPTVLELAEIDQKPPMDGRSLMQLVRGEEASFESSFYITECTWMRKHGWRTPEWKLIVALEPDFHGKPPVELYNHVEDPHEDHNLAEELPHVVETLKKQMQDWIDKRTQETGKDNPMHHQPGWHGHEGIDYFESSEQAFNTLHIGDPRQAQKLQAESRK